MKKNTIHYPWAISRPTLSSIILCITFILSPNMQADRIDDPDTIDSIFQETRKKQCAPKNVTIKKNLLVCGSAVIKKTLIVGSGTI